MSHEDQAGEGEHEKAFVLQSSALSGTDSSKGTPVDGSSSVLCGGDRDWAWCSHIQTNCVHFIRRNSPLIRFTFGGRRAVHTCHGCLRSAGLVPGTALSTGEMAVT